MKETKTPEWRIRGAGTGTLSRREFVSLVTVSLAPQIVAPQRDRWRLDSEGSVVGYKGWILRASDLGPDGSGRA